MNRSFYTKLLVGAASSLVLSAAASAQETELGEIVVTATRQSDTVNRVPLSITAVTQEGLDRQGVKSVADLSRTVPGMSLTAATQGDRIPNIAIRGIQSTIGAPTTGIYIDDTPLQKRNAIGLSGSGSPIPQLFDLERVEVLKGPQGTLYGGSSQGGTVRFITPAPSLTQYSGFAKGELATTKNGALSYEGGVAVGGPIVQDKVGFRLSLVGRRSGGWIDHVYRINGQTLEKDTNSRDQYAARLAVTFQVNDRLKITPAFYGSVDDQHDADTYWENMPRMTRAPYSYGPYNYFGPGKTGMNCNIGDQFVNAIQPCVAKQPRSHELAAPSLTFQYDFDTMEVKSITSYVYDRVKGNANFSFIEPAQFQGGVPFRADFPLYSAIPYYKNTRNGVVQELRFASKPTGSPLTWVAGVYYSNFNTHAPYHIVANFTDLYRTVFGTNFALPIGPGGVSYARDQRLWENEFAGFGEANYMVTDKLKLIGGVRVTRASFSYYQDTSGTLAGFMVPTIANGGLTEGSQTESPVTPKIGLQYQISDRDMVYATASKGFRVGGVNQPPPAARCAVDLTNLGITSTPNTYDSDSMWSYEAGAKVRTLGGRAQINASVFYIDWKDVQVSFGLPTCGFGYTVNAGQAVSKGLDLQTTVRLGGGLSASLQAAYTDAKYTSEVRGPAPTRSLFVAKGQRLPSPDWSVNLGLVYDFTLAGRYDAFVQANYQYNGDYPRSSPPGTGGYAPDVWQAEETHFVTARAGVNLDRIDLALFVDNLFDSQDVLGSIGGRTGCALATGAACTTFTANTPLYQNVTFRPRTVGVSASYRF